MVTVLCLLCKRTGSRQQASSTFFFSVYHIYSFHLPRLSIINSKKDSQANPLFKGMNQVQGLASDSYRCSHDGLFLNRSSSCSSSFSEVDSAASVTSMVSLCIAGSNPEMDSCGPVSGGTSAMPGFQGWLHLGCGSNQLHQTARLHSEASGHCFHSRTGVEVSASGG
ncbi:hypothetical protein V6N11_014034 [Hibiscus sabdariffa]|uniref:Uncharacterized protein n=2 Tax=Hibiscus sabdariffa TaxID=183260 RepID=A0ABR2AY71_9ROSI